LGRGNYRRHRRQNTVLIKLRENPTPEQLAALKALYEEFDLRAEKRLLKGKVVRLRIHNNSYSDQEEDIVEQIKKTEAVQFSEPDYIVPHAFVPNDPFYANQWHLAKIQSELSWNYTQGNSAVVVAVCDAGFDLTHPDLASQFILPGYNTVKNNTEVTNLHPHGTMTSGVIGAMGNNSLGVAGMAWRIRLLPIQISEQGDGVSTYSDVAECLQYASDQGAKVVNLSYDYAYASEVVKDAALYLRNAGGLLVAAAGNSSSDISSWGASPNMIIVGATDSADALASFSNHGTPVDLVAPGENIYTTIPGGYEVVSGTSFSTPIVAGTAALLYSLKPNFTPDQVENFLLSTVQDLGATGYDLTYAGGRISAGLAVQKAAAAVLTDNVAPSVAIAFPANNAIVSGILNIQVSASDNLGVAAVTFYIDANLLGTSTAVPYTFGLNTITLTNGAHSLSVKAVDASGNSSMSTITLNVNNQTAVAPAILLDNLTPGISDSSHSFIGKWCSSNLSGSYGITSLISCGAGTDIYRFKPSISAKGNYQISVHYLSSKNFSGKVPVTIKSATGSVTKRLNMRSGGGGWTSVGTYSFSAGNLNFVEFKDTAGIANVDGVKFEPVP
jgi:subtilisin family serine protease